MISKIQDGGGGHLENSNNRNISAMERAILTKFGTVMRLGPADTGSKYEKLHFNLLPRRIPSNYAKVKTN